MAIVMTADGINFPDNTSRSNRPLTRFASATLTSSINSVNSAQTDYVNISVGSNGPDKGLPAVVYSFDYFTTWGAAGYPWSSFVQYIERHLTASDSFVRVGIYHSAWGGPHVYTVGCVGNYFP